MATPLTEQIALILSRHSATAAELAHALHVSQPSVSRALNSLGAMIVRIGRGRATRYGLIKKHEGRLACDPLFTIDAQGHAEHIATLYRLESGESYIDCGHSHAWLLGTHGNGLFDDLPYYVLDMRPQGYLGRLVARYLAPECPADLVQWQSTHIADYLLAYGQDTPGNLVLGDVEAASQPREIVVAIDERDREYGVLVASTLAGDLPGSSAGGEQAKFLVTLRSNDGSMRRMIVKFSPPKDTPIGHRWADLLIMERLALSVLARADIPVATTTLFDTSNRTFLESERFDRIGLRGRAPMISLSAIDAEFIGGHASWRATAAALLAQSRIDRRTADQITLLDYFGELIANTDRHFHNISLTPTAAGTFQLCPVYDMLPMRYAPRNEIVDLPRRQVTPRKSDALWDRASQLAAEFWRAAQTEVGISPEFRRIISVELNGS